MNGQVEMRGFAPAWVDLDSPLGSTVDSCHQLFRACLPLSDVERRTGPVAVGRADNPPVVPNCGCQGIQGLKAQTPCPNFCFPASLVLQGFSQIPRIPDGLPGAIDPVLNARHNWCLVKFEDLTVT